MELRTSSSDFAPLPLDTPPILVVQSSPANTCVFFPPLFHPRRLIRFHISMKMEDNTLNEIDVGRREMSFDVTPSIASDPPALPVPANPTPISQGKVVSFGEVNIHEFSVGLGHNPGAISGGPPIQLDYTDPTGDHTIPILEYEDAIEGKRRRGIELRVPPDIRCQWVGGEGDDVELKEVRRIQHQRRITHASLDFEPWMLVIEHLRTKVRKLLSKEPQDCLAHQWNQQYKREKRAQRNR